LLLAVLSEQPSRLAHLYYGGRSGLDCAFKLGLRQLAMAHPGFDLHVLYADPGKGDEQGQDYDLPGYISVDLLKQALPHGHHAFYICGPDPMMQAMIPALLAWGVNDADIHRESFGPRTAALKPLVPATPGPAILISLRRSGRTLDWVGHDAGLLDFAERQSIEVKAGCRSGSCGTCETRLIFGRVVYAAKPDFDIPPGHCLLCVGPPATALELDA